MKFVTALAFAIAVATASSAYASEPTNKADCEKAHMKWDDSHHKCTKK
jgi:ABC-type proline/glycine betaine transport system substrate-binding protein